MNAKRKTPSEELDKLFEEILQPMLDWFTVAKKDTTEEYLAARHTFTSQFTAEAKAKITKLINEAYNKGYNAGLNI